MLARFMGMVMGDRAKFEPSQMVLTAGATPAIEISAFSLAQAGEAFLIPSPYYSGYVIHLRCSQTHHYKCAIYSPLFSTSGLGTHRGLLNNF